MFEALFIWVFHDSRNSFSTLLFINTATVSSVEALACKHGLAPFSFRRRPDVTVYLAILVNYSYADALPERHGTHVTAGATRVVSISSPSIPVYTLSVTASPVNATRCLGGDVLLHVLRLALPHERWCEKRFCQRVDRSSLCPITSDGDQMVLREIRLKPTRYSLRKRDGTCSPSCEYLKLVTVHWKLARDLMLPPMSVPKAKSIH